MSIPGVINMHNVFHNPAQYNYASLFQNTLALAFSKAHNTCLFGLLVLCLKCYLATLQFRMWTYSHLKLAADLKLKNLKGSKLLLNWLFS